MRLRHVIIDNLEGHKYDARVASKGTMLPLSSMKVGQLVQKFKQGDKITHTAW
jgi:hypothetical protein